MRASSEVSSKFLRGSGLFRWMKSKTGAATSKREVSTESQFQNVPQNNSCWAHHIDSARDTVRRAAIVSFHR